MGLMLAGYMTSPPAIPIFVILKSSLSSVAPAQFSLPPIPENGLAAGLQAALISEERILPAGIPVLDKYLLLHCQRLLIAILLLPFL